MAEAYLGEIRMFSGNFAPRNWAFCNGTILPVAQYEALFSLLGNNFGGDARTTFALPDLRGRVPIHMGSGPGLTQRFLGTKLGEEKVNLSINQMPSHNHPMQALSEPANSIDPAGRVPAETIDPITLYNVDKSGEEVKYFSDAVSQVGADIAHTNLQPYGCVSFIICIAGDYPQRN